MRVVLLTAAASWSGVEVHTVQLAGALKRRGHLPVIAELGRRVYALRSEKIPCELVCMDLGQGPINGAPLQSLGFRRWWRLFGALKADLAVLVRGNFQFGNHFLEAAARFRFPRFVVLEHMQAAPSKWGKGIHFNEGLPRLGLWWYRGWLSGYLHSVFPHKIVCVSKAAARTLQEDYGYPSSKLAAVHNGVDTTVFTPSRARRRKARLDWRIPDDAFVFGAVGRISPMKNHGQLISAFSKLCKGGCGRDVRLVIVGDGPLRGSLEEVVRSSGLESRIQFNGFSETPEKVYPGFDVLCFPSTSGESLPLVLLEAMSCECPVIAAAVGGVPEILNDPRVGWLVPSGDENALLTAMQQALDLSSEGFRKLGASAREHVVSRFNAADRLQELVEVIESEV